MKIHTTRTFEAAHRLDFLPKTHKCSRLHGHSYEVVVDITAREDANGMVIDYAEVHAVIDRLDHDFLNEIMKEPTTTENVAKWILKEINALLNLNDPGTDITVRVYEGAHRHYAEVFSRGF